MIIWKDEYCIGVELIDKQHKYLFEIGNSAYRLLRDESITNKYEDVLLIIQDLHQYSKFHFKTEEEYMLKINYSEYLAQKSDHDKFIQLIDEMSPQQVEKDQKKYLEAILALVFNWLIEHIMLKDKLIKVE